MAAAGKTTDRPNPVCKQEPLRRYVEKRNRNGFFHACFSPMFPAFPHFFRGLNVTPRPWLFWLMKAFPDLLRGKSHEDAGQPAAVASVDRPDVGRCC